MRKAHLACVLLGMVLGSLMGVGLVILQLKYGSGPVVSSAEACAHAGQSSCLDEPKALEPEGSTEEGSGPGSVEPIGHRVDEPEPTPSVVPPRPAAARTPRTPPAAAAAAGAVEQAAVERLTELEHMLREHLLRHAQEKARARQEPTNAEQVGPPPPPPPAWVPVPQPYYAPPPPPWVQGPVPPPPMSAVPAPEAVPMPPPVIRHPALLAVPDFNRPLFGWPHGGEFLPFTGSHACVLSAPGRLTLPAPVQAQLGKQKVCTLFAAPGPEQTIWLFPPEGIARLAGKFEHELGSDEDARRCWRLCFSRIIRVEARDGRLSLPAELIEFAGLESALMVIGVGDHFEIWNADHWQIYSDDGDDQPEPIEVPSRQVRKQVSAQSDQAATEILIRVLGLLRDAGDLPKEWERLCPSGSAEDDEPMPGEDYE